MNLRNLPTDLTPHERCTQRRELIEKELGVDLSQTVLDESQVGHADEKNCEQMFGAVPVPVGYAGPLTFQVSSGEDTTVHLPLATTEGALAASVNRGCKILNLAESFKTRSERKGCSRSICLRLEHEGVQSFSAFVQDQCNTWKEIAETTSNHLTLVDHTIDVHEDHVFLTAYFDTDEAMGMNMVTIAMQQVGQWLCEKYDQHDIEFITVAGNIDSDKKPSQRTHDKGRGFRVTASASISTEIVQKQLQIEPEALLKVARAKLEIGSSIAGAIGSNLHTANIIAALYLATGQDAAHIVEGSLSDTHVTETANGDVSIEAHLPALMLGIRGGGTSLPAQAQCLALLLQPETSLHPCAQLAETIGAAVLAGELSLLAAQASHSLAKAHQELGR